LAGRERPKWEGAAEWTESAPPAAAAGGEPAAGRQEAQDVTLIERTEPKWRNALRWLPRPAARSARQAAGPKWRRRKSRKWA